MSEFTPNWQEGMSNVQLSNEFKGVVQQLKKREDIPHGDAWDIALAMVSMGGPENSVRLVGPPGTGKSKTAEVFLGSRYIVDLRSTDTDQTLLGYERPLGEGHVKGSIGGMLLDHDDKRLGLDEVGNLASTRGLHPLFNGAGFYTLGGQDYVDTTAMPIMVTTNFPDRSKGVYDQDSAFRSRLGGGFTANLGAIPFRDNGNRGERMPEPGVVPDEKNRRQLQNMMYEHPVNENEAQEYANALLTSMNTSGLFVTVDPDARISQGWQQVVRARRLAMGKATVPISVQGRLSMPEIGRNDLRDTAVIGLGAVSILSQSAVSEIVDVLDVPRLSYHERALIAQRVIAAMAKLTSAQVVNGKPVNLDDQTLKQHMDKFSFVETNSLPRSDEIDEAIFALVRGENAKAKKDSHGKKYRLPWRR